MSKKRNKKYNEELKIRAVKSYLEREGGQPEICRRYGISSHSVLGRWIKWYNGHKEFKNRSAAKGEIYMTKVRKTTQAERSEMVAFCIEHGRDYGLTVETYKVSYSQIYSWVRKYEEKGIEGLRDGRGRSKGVEEMNETERLCMENKILRAKLQDAEIENKLLKKLRELRGGDH